MLFFVNLKLGIVFAILVTNEGKIQKKQFSRTRVKVNNDHKSAILNSIKLKFFKAYPP